MKSIIFTGDNPAKVRDGIDIDRNTFNEFCESDVAGNSFELIHSINPDSEFLQTDEFVKALADLPRQKKLMLFGFFSDNSIPVSPAFCEWLSESIKSAEYFNGRLMGLVLASGGESAKATLMKILPDIDKQFDMAHLLWCWEAMN